MDPFARALEVVAAGMREAMSHPPIERSPECHVARAEEHLRLLRAGDQRPATYRTRAADSSWL
jgi:hypothetical protein